MDKIETEHDGTIRKKWYVEEIPDDFEDWSGKEQKEWLEDLPPGDVQCSEDWDLFSLEITRNYLDS
jgi:hypothetical protein